MSPKKSKSAGKKAKQGHPARAASNQNIVSIDAYRVRSNPSEDAIFPIFTRWMGENHIPADIGDPLPTLREYMASYHQVNGASGFTHLREPGLSGAMRLHLERHGEDATAQLLYTLLVYLLFLEDAGLWSGSDAEISQVKVLLENLLGLGEEDFEEDEEIFVPAIDKRAAVEELSALPLAGRVRSFMEWFGEKRKVTATGMLTRQDIEGAAGSLGVDAVGVSSGASTLPLPAGETQRATRSQDVARLDLYWEALLAVGVVELSSTSAWLYNSVEIFTDPQRTDELVLLLRDVAQSMYDRVATSRYVEAGRDAGLPHELVAELLLDACDEDGFPVQDLTAFAQESDPEVAAPYAAAQLVLERLADEGLLRIGESYTVPDSLLKPAAFTLGVELDIPVLYEDPRDEEPGYVGAEDDDAETNGVISGSLVAE